MENGEKLYSLFQKLGEEYPAKGTIFLPEPQRNEELKKIFEVYLENGKISNATRTAKLLAEPHRTEAIMQLTRECKWLSDCLGLVDLLSEPQRTTELRRMLESYYKNERLEAAEETAHFLSESERTEEFAKIIDRYIKKSQFDNARKIADFILKNHQK